MNQHNSFFSLAEIKQPVNQWICVAFLGVWCFWIVLYWLGEKAINATEAYTNPVSAITF